MFNKLTTKSIPNEAEVLEEAKRLRDQGMCWRQISRQIAVGVSDTWYRRRLEPGYSERQKAYSSRYDRPYNYASPRKSTSPQVSPRPMSDADLKRYRENMPPDDRDLGARLMGDPPSHRSALGRRST